MIEIELTAARLYHPLWTCIANAKGMIRRTMLDWTRPNGLRFSGGAPLDRESGWAASRFQKRPDLVGAKRRPLQPLVGRQLRRFL